LLFFVFFVIPFFPFSLSLTTIFICLIAGEKPSQLRQDKVKLKARKRDDGYSRLRSETSILGWWFLLRGGQPKTQKRPRKGECIEKEKKLLKWQDDELAEATKSHQQLRASENESGSRRI
jgi:hypothetical protein